MEKPRYFKTRGTPVSLRRKSFSLLIIICAKKFDHVSGYSLVKPRLLYEISGHDDSWAVKVWSSFGPATSLHLLHALPRKTSRKYTGEEIWASSSHCHSVRYRYTFIVWKWIDIRGNIKWQRCSLCPKWTIQCNGVAMHRKKRRRRWR